MIDISLSIEGMMGLTWPLWKQWVDMAEGCDFYGLYRSDHFTVNDSPPDQDSLECWISLAYLASHTERIRFGPLVSPVTFRDPVMLARQGSALDDLSDGRFVLGVGAGWHEREHTMFNYPLGDTNERYARWEEGLQVITQLLHRAEPVSFNGKYYILREAVLLPRSQRLHGPSVLIGGRGPKRTLQLAARYADVWNAHSMSPDTFRERSMALDKMLIAQGRRPQDVKRTMAVFCFCGHTAEALERRLKVPRSWDPTLAEKSREAQIEILNHEWHCIAGGVDDALEQVRAYAAVGVEEIMLQWFDMEDVEGAEVFTNQLLSRL